MFPQYSSNMSLINPADLNVMNTGMGGMYGAAIPGMNMDVMQGAKMLPNQMTAPQDGMSNMDKMSMMKMAAGALQNLAPRQQMPSGNTAQIIRDSNQLRFAGTPQQQMAQALRRRG